jgi:hypothetical protein
LSADWLILILAADAYLPYIGDYRISLPDEADKPLSISKTRTGFFAPAAADRISLHVESIEVTSLEIFREKPFNERIAASIKALHVGDVYGSFSKLLYYASYYRHTHLD